MFYDNKFTETSDESGVIRWFLIEIVRPSCVTTRKNWTSGLKSQK